MISITSASKIPKIELPTIAIGLAVVEVPTTTAVSRPATIDDVQLVWITDQPTAASCLTGAALPTK